MGSPLRLSIISILATFTMLPIACAQAQSVAVDELWGNEAYTTAADIRTKYDDIQKEIGKSDKESAIKNKCNLIWWGGEYSIKNKGNDNNLTRIAEIVDTLSFDNITVQQFVQSRDIEKFADYYFMFKAMRRGATFDAARDGLTVTVFFPIRAINNNDYTKLREVFSYNNSELHNAFLEKMKFPFRNSGCTKELYAIMPLIEKNVADSKLKSEILELYSRYTPIMEGKKAPQVTLSDSEGKEHTLAEFEGKILVIDVWATWCSSCLAKMPQYMKLREEFADNAAVEFITLSIDRNKKRELWLTTLKKYSMESMTNLIVNSDEYSEFEDKYNVSGVPRYIIIDKNGNIITAYAPTPGDNMREIICEYLNK